MKPERCTCQMSSKVCLDEDAVAIIRGVPACSRCVEEYENREPSDEQILNGPHIEGGINGRDDRRHG